MLWMFEEICRIVFMISDIGGFLLFVDELFGILMNANSFGLFNACVCLFVCLFVLGS